MSTYDIVFIFANALSIFSIYKFLGVFFTKKLYSQKIELLSYVVFYLIILLIYFFVNLPIVMISVNIIGRICVSFNYESNIGKKILATTLSFLVSMAIEFMVAAITGSFNIPLLKNNNYASIFGLVSAQILIYMISLFFNKCKNIKQGQDIPLIYWVCIILIPASTLYIALIIFLIGYPTQSQVILTMLAVLLINFFTFYLYDAIVFAFTDKMERALLRQQNNYYENQVELMKISMQNSRSLSHDLKNHLYTMASLLEKGCSNDVLLHISQMTEMCDNGRRYANSGNIIVDSVLNFKLQQAIDKNIEIKLKMAIPNEIEIKSFDIAIILGNLIDNAIDAVCKLSEGRYIDIKIKYNSGRILIEISNPYNGEITKEKGNFITTHKDKSNHGIGISNVKGVVKKYKGDMNIIFDNEKFSVYILMYVL